MRYPSQPNPASGQVYRHGVLHTAAPVTEQEGQHTVNYDFTLHTQLKINQVASSKYNIQNMQASDIIANSVALMSKKYTHLQHKIHKTRSSKLSRRAVC